MEPFWRPNRAKIGPRRVLRRDLFENVVCHEIVRFPTQNHPKRPQDGHKIGPRSPQDGLKTDQENYRFFNRFYHRFLVVFDSVLAPSWGVLGCQGVVLGSFGRPLGSPRRSQNRFLGGRDLPLCWLGSVNRFQDRPRPPKTPKRPPKTLPRAPQDDPKWLTSTPETTPNDQK